MLCRACSLILSQLRWYEHNVKKISMLFQRSHCLYPILSTYTFETSHVMKALHAITTMVKSETILALGKFHVLLITDLWEATHVMDLFMLC
jgi:hypothetical protein